jgi:THO complex subunit 5
VEEFYANAPPEISKPEVTKTNEHRLRLAQLDWELIQRQKYYLRSLFSTTLTFF